MATAAVVNAVWDLWAKVEGKPVWKLVADMTPNGVRPLHRLPLHHRRHLAGRSARHARKTRRPGKRAKPRCRGRATPLTSPPPAGSATRKTRCARLFREALAQGWNHFKVKVGTNVDDDIRRLEITREEIGTHRTLMMDANQVWDVGKAIDHMRELDGFDLRGSKNRRAPTTSSATPPLREHSSQWAWRPASMATTGSCSSNCSRPKRSTICQVDSCRLGGLNEVLAVLLMAAKFGVPVCPHAGGVGLCEYVQHISLFDYICVSASLEDRVEFADHLHEHFVDPVVVENAHYLRRQRRATALR